MSKPRSAARTFATALAVCLAVSWTGAAMTAPARDASDSIIAGLKIRIESRILNETREVWVMLPAEYENGQGRFPVIIELGGGAHFLYSAAVSDFLSRNDHIPPVIVAAVPEPTPAHHYRDSTPTRVDYLPTSGGAPLFLRFLREELIPTLEARFRTQPSRILCGHGLSGLFAVYALMESPGSFRAVITDGASLAYDDFAILKWAELRLADPGVRGALYLGAGNELETIPGLKAFAGVLEGKAGAGLEWKMEIHADEDQGTASLPSFYNGLKWVFRGWRLPVEVASRGMGAVRDYYQALSAKLGYEIPVTEKTLAVRGFLLMREQRFDEALVLFDINAAAFPDSPGVYHNLAVLGERRKQWDKAASFYETAAQKAERSQPDLARFFRMKAGQAKSRAANID